MATAGRRRQSVGRSASGRQPPGTLAWDGAIGPPPAGLPASAAALVYASPYAMWLQSELQGPILLANALAMRQYGYSDDEFAALDLRELAADGKLCLPTEPSRLRHRRRDGRTLDVEVCAAPVEFDGRAYFAVTARLLTLAEQGDGISVTELIESLDGMVWEIDAHTMLYRYVSAQAPRLLGYPVASWMMPTFWVEHIHPDDRERAIGQRAGALAAGRDFACDYRMFSADGGVVWLRDVVSVVCEAGRPVLMRGVSLDVSASKAAEIVRDEAFDTLASTVDAIPALVAVIDADERFQLANRRYAEWFGVDQQELLGRNVAEVLGEAASQDLLVHVRNALAGHEERHESPIDDLYGNQHWLESCYVPRLAAGGAVLGTVVLMFDISERKRAEWALNRLTADLDQRVQARTSELIAAVRELEAFSYAVSHDLTAPLRSVDGFASILLDDLGDVLDARGREHLGRIRAAAARMARLIDDLLNLSQISRREIRPVPVDLSTMAAEVLAELEAASPTRRVACVLERGISVEGDSGLLRVVLDNLLGNAWKYTRNVPSAEIRFGRAPWRGRPAFFVKDNGIGFDMAYAGKLFGAFQRLHSDPQFEGSGIGLATAQRIIRRHGGDIWAESAPGRGATFWFTLGGRAALPTQTLE